MRTATTIEGSGGNWREITEFVCEAEKLGLDICWVAEAWGSDAPSPLGYLAARTEAMLLGSAAGTEGRRTCPAGDCPPAPPVPLTGGQDFLARPRAGPRDNDSAPRGPLMDPFMDLPPACG